MSEGQQPFSSNACGPRESIKHSSWDTLKICWFPMLVRGKLELLPADFPGETPAGAAILAFPAAFRSCCFVVVWGYGRQTSG